MPTTVQDAYSQMAGVIETTITNEFTDIQYLQVHHDRIHESLGADGVCHVGISPDDISPRRAATADTDITIQFYNAYHADVDPFQEVDPRIVTNQAERLKRALARVRVIGSSETWFFTINTIRFIPDPTGNKSRFEMIVTGTGDDMSLMETIG